MSWERGNVVRVIAADAAIARGTLCVVTAATERVAWVRPMESGAKSEKVSPKAIELVSERSALDAGDAGHGAERGASGHPATVDEVPAPVVEVRRRCDADSAPHREPATVGGAVDHPEHYRLIDGMEAEDVIEAVTSGLPATSAWLLGNVLKYALRAGRKGDASQDLGKAANYAHRLVTGRWRDCIIGGE
jgi:hypothetical protein